MAQFDLALPKFGAGDLDDEKQRRKIMNYLVKLDEQLRFVLNNLDTENFTETFQQVIISSGGGSGESSESLKALEEEINRLSTKVTQTANEIALKASAEELNELGDLMRSLNAEFKVLAGEISTKVSREEYNALKGTVDSHSTSIKQTADQIVLKADKTAVDALSGTVSKHSAQFEVTAEQISSTVERVDTLDGVVQKQGTAITQTAEKIESKAEASVVNALGDTVAKHESAISQTPEEIRMAVESVQIGGRNYILGTGTPYTAVGTGSRQWLYPWKCASIAANRSLYGKTVTISYDYKAAITSGSFNVGINDLWLGVQTFNSSTGSGHFTLTRDYAEFNTGSDVFIYIDGTWTGSVTFSNVKVEIGNKATDWTPAPEDTDGAINELSAQLSVQAGEITSNATKIETVSQAAGNAQTTANAAQNAANSAQGTASGAVTRVTAAEQRISAVEGSITSKVSKEEFDVLGRLVSAQETKIEQTDEQVLILAGRRAGGTQLLKNGGFYGGLNDWSKLEYKVNGEWRNLYTESASPNNYRANEVPNLVLHAQNETGMFGAAQVVKGLRKNTEYTISGYVASHRNNRACIEIRNTSATRWALQKSFDVGWGGTNLSAYNRFEYTFDTADYTDYQITLYSNNFGENAYVWWAQVKLEEGNTATAWSPHPDDPASGVNAGGVVRVDQTGVHMSGGTIEMETSDGDEYIHIRNDGISASSLSAPDVTPRYGGPGTLYVNPNATSEQIAKGDTFRSLADALAKLSGRWVGYNVTINLAAGMTEYGSLSLVGVSGGWWITIQGNSSNPAKLVGGLYAYHGSSPVSVKYLNVDATGDRGVHAEGGGQMVQVSNCVITGNGNAGTYGICSYRGACVEVENCEVYDFSRSLYGHNCGLLTGYNCKGNNQVGANHSTIYLRGTMPCDSPTWAYAASWAGQVIATSITVDQGSKPTPIPAPTTAVYDLLHADSYAAGNVNSWVYPEGKPNDDIYQGYTGQAGRICGCMWFDNAAIRNALSGKTIKQASIRLTAQRYVGYGREVTVYLRGTATSYSGRSGQPALTTDYGIIGTAEPAVTGTFTIPAQAISDIASGAIEGLVLYHQDTADMQGKNYSRNYMRFDGSTSGDAETRPRLTVVYQ